MPICKYRTCEIGNLKVAETHLWGDIDAAYEVISLQSAALIHTHILTQPMSCTPLVFRAKIQT